MNAPLAYRVRPHTLDDIIGQKHLVGEDGFLRHLMESNTLVSMIFYGPPGSGKTTLAEAFSRSMDAHLIKLNAVTSNKKEMEAAIEESRLFPHPIIIMDEVHRLSKDKQDLLLPFIESGTIYLIGATTANPYIAINPAIRSRCHLLEVKPLTQKEIIEGIHRVIELPNGLNNMYTFSDEAVATIARLASGDMRFAMNLVEVATLGSKKMHIEKSDIDAITKIPNYLMDQDENGHYDAVSALQKSIRGSDVDAALYYLARLCAAGDLESIERRLLVTAYEDIGLANPQAVTRCATALESARKVGFPEAVIPLGFTVCDLALSPKSKVACNAIHKAMDVATSSPLDVMDYLKLTPVNVQEEDKYPYDRPDIWEKIQYLPELIKNMQFYEPSDHSSYERALNENYRRLKKQGRSKDLRRLKKL
ncbi:MAG: replication-associated recombination protein A [Coprobacillus sp.]|nr:replication-associated recombination protein A [Coprobacillus sp.]